ncbi:MAG: RHS repeat-associated core domain-containing protein [Verrucomicrobiaceae bacterium]|nr:MAG: RHS repeat-associated core domain-containing protein [Verrucomicrobiaceae bacterium]
MPESGRPVQAYCGSLGHRKDDETGLIYMRARYYDPQVGRFTSEDPARDGFNWYAYCDNNPVSNADLDGRFCFADALISGLIGAAFNAGLTLGQQIVSGGARAINLQEVVYGAFQGFLGGFVLGGFAAGANLPAMKETLSALAFLTSSKELGFKLCMTFGIGGITALGNGALNVGRGTASAVWSMMGRNIHCMSILAEMDLE